MRDPNPTTDYRTLARDADRRLDILGVAQGASRDRLASLGADALDTFRRALDALLSLLDAPDPAPPVEENRRLREALQKTTDYLDTAARIIRESPDFDEGDDEDACQVITAARKLLSPVESTEGGGKESK